MTRRLTGWLLLAWAAGAAVVAGVLTRVSGRTDALLVVVVAVGVLGAATLVVSDAARRRRQPPDA